MTIFLRGACALLVGAALSGFAAAQQSQPGAISAMFEGVTSEAGSIEQVSCNSGCSDYGGDYGGDYSGGCDDCGPACDLGCDTGCGVGGGLPPGQVFVGAEWLNVRAGFSEATGYRVTDLNTGVTDLVQHTFDYTSSYRLYAGYRLCDCGDEIRFTYTNFDSDGGFDEIANDPQNGILVTSAYEAVALDPNDTVRGRSRVQVDNYDLGFSKTIPLGCPLTCCDTGCGDCCDTGCGDCCGCGPVCPAWDITWGGGIRFASVDSELASYTTRAGTNAPPAFSSSTVNFDGAGLRFGLGGRRYFGRAGAISAYVKGDISLLLGEVDYQVQTIPGLPTTRISTTQVVPVTEIEAGLTANLTQNVTFSAGYLLSAWHDLGHRAEYDYGITGTQIQSMDDANMMTFDGMFLRAEAAF